MSAIFKKAAFLKAENIPLTLVSKPLDRALGAVSMKLGQKTEAVDANKRALQLPRKDQDHVVTYGLFCRSWDI